MDDQARHRNEAWGKQNWLVFCHGLIYKSVPVPAVLILKYYRQKAKLELFFAASS